MTKNSEKPQWGSFALVSYIPDPLGSYFDSLRQILPGKENPQAHITILPPRPLKLPVESASLQAKKILERFSRFEVELAKVHFFPETHVVYLDIAEGNAPLHDLHDALNTGDLDAAENFEFRPHLTLGGPVPEQDVEEVRTQAEQDWHASGWSPRFAIDEVVFLWLRPSGSWDDWHRLWSHRLKTEGSGKAATAGPTTRTS
jgi:2'-5' RNA ligase